MSHLNFFKKTVAKEIHLPIPANNLPYENHVEHKCLDAFNLLCMSKFRETVANETEITKIKTHLDNLNALLSATRIPNSAPFAFHWKYNDTEYFSTSLMFEIHTITALSACNQMNLALKTLDGYSAKNSFQLLSTLRKWPTRTMIEPSQPLFTMEHWWGSVQNFAKGTFYLWKALEIEENVKRGVALSSAHHFLQQCWPREPHYGEIATSHYLVARALLYRLVGERNIDDPQTMLGCYNETLNCLNQLNLDKARIDTDKFETMLQLEDTREQVGANQINKNELHIPLNPLEDIKLPKHIE